MFNSRKHSYRVILKTGGSFRIEANDLDLEFDDATGQIIKYEFTDPKGEIPCNPIPARDIATIVENKKK
jgi:hypothetical protein